MKRKLINTQTWLMISMTVDADLAHPQNADSLPPTLFPLLAGKLMGKLQLSTRASERRERRRATSGDGRTRTASANSASQTAATRGRTGRPIAIKIAANAVRSSIHCNRRGNIFFVLLFQLIYPMLALFLEYALEPKPKQAAATASKIAIFLAWTATSASLASIRRELLCKQKKITNDGPISPSFRRTIKETLLVIIL